jgi:hypothetical protein
MGSNAHPISDHAYTSVLVGIYIIMATGIWYHELENLSVDGEDLIRNASYPDL